MKQQYYRKNKTYSALQVHLKAHFQGFIYFFPTVVCTRAWYLCWNKTNAQMCVECRIFHVHQFWQLSAVVSDFHEIVLIYYLENSISRRADCIAIITLAQLLHLLTVTTCISDTYHMCRAWLMPRWRRRSYPLPKFLRAKDRRRSGRFTAPKENNWDYVRWWWRWEQRWAGANKIINSEVEFLPSDETDVNLTARWRRFINSSPVVMVCGFSLHTYRWIVIKFARLVS